MDNNETKAEPGAQPDQSAPVATTDKPAQTAEPDAAVKPEKPSKPQADKPKAAPADKRPCIIVADTDTKDVETITKVAGDEGCAVRAVADMRSLIAEIDRLQPLLVFVNRTTPQLNLSLLCRKAQQRQTAVVLQGVFRSPNELISVVKLGVVDVMTKPLSSEVVLRKILQSLAYVKKNLHRKLEAAANIGEDGVDIEEQVRAMIAAARDLMVMPHVAAQLIALSGQPNANVADLAKVASSDPAVSLMLFRRANSAAYGSASQAKTLPEAIVRMGFRTVRSIVTIAAVYKMSDGDHKAPGLNRVGHWIHSLAAGVIAESVAEAAKFAAPEDAFLAGVLHDFGKLVFDDHLHREYLKVHQMATEKNTTVHAMELEHFKTAHETVGGELSRNWRLPEHIGEAIRMHHADDKIWNDPEDRQHNLTRFVWLADHAARAMMLGFGSDMYGLPVQDQKWQALGLHNLDLHKLSATAIRRVGEMIQWLGISADRAGLPHPPLPKDEKIWILDGDGTTDRLLDMFVTTLGYDAVHGQADKPPDSRPAGIILDLREQTLSPDDLHETWKTQAEVPVYLLGAQNTALEALPSKPAHIPMPLDFLTLSQAMTASEKDK